jgi:A/G-specific adenine glycosylase
VDQGLPYYLRFAGRFKNVKDLAKAGPDEVMKLWQGLGYYSRARNMHETARIVARDHKGKFPTSYDELISLKGIGDYTAAAISSFAANEPRAVLDGNVMRVLARFTGKQIAINSTAGRKFFSGIASNLLDRDQPGLHNQAMMELGATVCKPRNPECHACVLQGGCVAYKKSSQHILPVKNSTRQVRVRHFNYLYIEEKDRIFIWQRNGNDI